MGWWMALDGRRRTFVVLTAAVVFVSIAYALNIRFVLAGQQAVTAIDDIGEAVAAALASAACAWAASRASGRDRLGWALMAISTGLWAAGEVVWSIYEVGLRVTVPSPSLAWRVWFDGVIVALALTSTAWGFGLRTVYEAGGPWAAKALNLAYPLSDIVVGTVLILAIRRATGQQKGRMAFLLAGVAAYSLADSAFSSLSAQGAIASVGNILDTGWFAGFLLIALAAIYPSAPAKLAVKQAQLDLWQLALPWMTLLLASAGDVYSALSGHELDLFMSSLTATLAILLTVNMIIERREFLEMLSEIESSRSTLNQEIKTGLDAIQHFSKQLHDVERNELDDVRRIAADISRTADRLDRAVEGILSTDDEDEASVGLAAHVPLGLNAASWRPATPTELSPRL